MADVARKIDAKHHTDKDGNIIKTGNGVPVPEDEPLFLFRARDNLALAVLSHYRRLCVDSLCTDYQLAGVDEMIEKFRKYRDDHPDTMKQPGITRGK